MKPLLRVVLIVDALMLLGVGVLLLLTPWTSLYNALQLVQPQPVVVGLMLGVVLLALSWLAVRAAFHGAMTAPVGRVIGHVNWINGVLLLVWLIGLHDPPLTGLGEIVAGGLGAWLIVIGLGGVRLAGVVRLRDKAQAAGNTQARRDATPPAPKVEARAESPVDSPVYTAPAAAPAATSNPAPVYTGPLPLTTRTVVEPPPSATGDARLAAEPAQTPEQRTEAARDAARHEAATAPRPPFNG